MMRNRFMSKAIFLVLILCLAIFGSINCFAQIGEQDFEKADKLEHRCAEIIDSTLYLTNNTALIYSHDSLFRCIHLEKSDGEIEIIHVVYLNDYAGYTAFKKDLDDKVLFEIRSDGSGNEPFYMAVDKTTGEWESVSDQK